jgi:SAM-dependent methyltransferase
MPATKDFDELVAEGAAVPVEGWDFSWFRGRATEQRPSWGYSRLLAERVGGAAATVDIQTGGGEVFAEVLGNAKHLPRVVAATESWSPNVEIARRGLVPLGALVVQAADDGHLPFRDGSFDLVASRHPIVTAWEEVARVLRAGGSYLSQQVGPGSNRELYEFMMGPQPPSQARSPRRAVESAQAAGLVVVDLRQESLETASNDVGAVVHFLRKVLWTVPGFTVERYRDPLLALHEQIERDGPFVAHAQRFLIEAQKPV